MHSCEGGICFKGIKLTVVVVVVIVMIIYVEYTNISVYLYKTISMQCICMLGILK